jgi:inner membrane protein involved in colicin E2 resistance
MKRQKMKDKESSEFADFDKVMDGLLSVPYSELQKKLEEEKREKEKQKGRRTTSLPASSPASSSRKKRVG